MLLSFFDWLQHIPWIVAITGSVVGSATVWLIHYLSFFLLVGTIAFVDLRILGIAGRRQGLANLAGQLFPWMWLGLILAVLSGFIMFAGYAKTYYDFWVFLIKMGVFLLAVVFGIIVERNVPKWDRLPTIPIGAKALAFISLALWIGVILAGVEVPAFINSLDFFYNALLV